MGQGARERFLGHWAVDRHVSDFDSGWTGRFEGRAVFAPVPGALDYLEEGTLRLGGLTIETRRRLRWTFPAADEVLVAFEDGRVFHRFDPRFARAEAAFADEGETVAITYHFHDWDHWQADWRVEGPRKDYRTVTHYRREG